MTRDELIARLKKYEWSDVEFKKAQRGVPEDAFRTVSAFANTAGGWLVFGVEDRPGTLEIVGVIEVDKVQNDFLSALRSRQKLNRSINVQESALEHEDKTLLVFYIPEALRQDKPVYLQGDIRQSFLRRGGGDEKCSQEELERLLRDASSERYDAQLVEFDLASCFDASTITWYRNVYERKPGNRSHAEKTDLDFLFELGLVKETPQGLKATKAAILLFGRDGYFRNLLPRITVDCQRYGCPHSELARQPRWVDRLVLDFNLIRSWQALTEWYQKLSEIPFRVDPTTMQRTDLPADYVAFRESAINILIHQDFADHTRKPEISHFTDRTIFWNPGDAFAADVDLLEPGAKEVRNPGIVGAFRRIGLSENSGWGLRDVFTNWQQLGNVPPQISNDKAKKTFQLILLKEQLLSDEQILFQAGLGVHLTEEQAKVFAYACRNGGILSVSDVKAITALNSSASHALLRQLMIQALLEAAEEGVRYTVASHLRERFVAPTAQGDLSTAQAGSASGSLSTAQAGSASDSLSTAQADLSTAQAGSASGSLSTAQVQPLTQLSETQWSIVAFCDTPRSMGELVERLGVSNRGYFKKRHLDPLIAGGVVRLTLPEAPRSPNQRYGLTEPGAHLKSRRVAAADESEKE